MTTNDGGPAFPVKIKRNTPTDPLITPREFQMPGMSLRDWFAGQALAGMCAHNDGWGLSVPKLGGVAYEIADALLAARAKGGDA